MTSNLSGTPVPAANLIYKPQGARTMLANVTCPACQHRYLLDEGEMGSRQMCPKCLAPFFAGASVAEARSGALAAGPRASYDKTMLGDSGPPIKYNCPRCKAPLEAAAIEAGTKKNCPNCSQRIQVPAQTKPEPVAPAPNLNKTMLAGDESAAPPRPPIKYNCPNCKKPLEAPAEQAGTKTNCPSCKQRLQIPAAPPGTPNLNKTMLAANESTTAATASQGVASANGAGGPAAAGSPAAAGPWASLLTPRNVALGVVALLLLLFVVPAVIRGGKSVDSEALARAKLDLERLKMEIEQKKAEYDRQARGAADAQRLLDEAIRKNRDHEEELRKADLRRLRNIDDEDRAALERKLKQEQQKREEARLAREKESERLLNEARQKLEATKQALDASQQRQQTIIQQPPPVMYYPPYHPRYYWPWW
jgi:DNA-directed RNA polymerase subunit RPC12/RpoP